jgi:tetratricopeptide (TPR) repeat protein
MAEGLEKLLAVGALARREGRMEDALCAYQQAADQCRKRGNALVTAHTIRHLGDIYRELGKTDEAEPLLKEAISIYRGSLDAKILDFANALRPLALLYVSTGNTQAAQQLWRQARALYSAINVADGVNECDTHLNPGTIP